MTEMSVYGTPLSLLKLLPFAFHAVFVIFANLLRLLLYLQRFRNFQVFYFLREIRNKQVYSWEMLKWAEENVSGILEDWNMPTSGISSLVFCADGDERMTSVRLYSSLKHKM